MLQVPTKEEFDRVCADLQACRRDVELVKQLLTGQQWMSREKTMLALDVCKTTLWKLTRANQITYRKNGRKIQYDVFSIRNYLTAQKIGADVVDSQILKAVFG